MTLPPHLRAFLWLNFGFDEHEWGPDEIVF
ncbi:hypothetical protein Pan3_32 [Pseudanabaena phage Pan3]|nr:hypothetical protein Pan3_32 [Pseudanabaena phage Pan3]